MIKPHRIPRSPRSRGIPLQAGLRSLVFVVVLAIDAYFPIETSPGYTVLHTSSQRRRFVFALAFSQHLPPCAVKDLDLIISKSFLSRAWDSTESREVDKSRRPTPQNFSQHWRWRHLWVT